jgi:hypothetical protein
MYACRNTMGDRTLFYRAQRRNLNIFIRSIMSMLPEGLPKAERYVDPSWYDPTDRAEAAAFAATDGERGEVHAGADELRSNALRPCSLCQLMVKRPSLASSTETWSLSKDWQASVWKDARHGGHEA